MKRRIQIFDCNEVNSLLDRISTMSHVEYNRLYEDRDTSKQSLTLYSFVKFNPKTVTITTKYGPNMLPTTYIFNRDDSVAHLRSGSEEYGTFMQSAKEFVPSFEEDEWTKKHLGYEEGKFLTKNAGIQRYNKKFVGQKTYAWEYDLNSAYLSVLYNKMPDTRIVSHDPILKEGWVGFLVTDSLILVTEPGSIVEIQFPLIDTPDKIKRYCERWFELCRNKEKKLNAKHQIVDSIGYLQYKNPYLRAYIIETCNNYILSLTDPEHTILVNTDAVFSDIPLDLNTGLNIGEFKVKEGYIQINGLDYDSDDFGSVHRGQQKNNYYEVIDNRLYRIGD